MKRLVVDLGALKAHLETHTRAASAEAFGISARSITRLVGRASAIRVSRADSRAIPPGFAAEVRTQNVAARPLRNLMRRYSATQAQVLRWADDCGTPIARVVKRLRRAQPGNFAPVAVGLTVDQACRLWTCEPATLRRWCAEAGVACLPPPAKSRTECGRYATLADARAKKKHIPSVSRVAELGVSWDVYWLATTLGRPSGWRLDLSEHQIDWRAERVGHETDYQA